MCVPCFITCIWQTFTDTCSLLRPTPPLTLLHTTQVFLLLSGLRPQVPLITLGRLSTFPGQIIKSNSRNPHALPSAAWHLKPAGVLGESPGMSVRYRKKTEMERWKQIKKETRMPVTVFTFVLISLTASLWSHSACVHTLSFWPVNTSQWIQSLSNTALRTDRGSPPVLLDYRRAGEVRADWWLTGGTDEEMDEVRKGDPRCFPPLAASLV